jgi:hypothetical protein
MNIYLSISSKIVKFEVTASRTGIEVRYNVTDITPQKISLWFLMMEEPRPITFMETEGLLLNSQQSSSRS